MGGRGRGTSEAKTAGVPKRAPARSAAKGGCEATLTNAARCTNVRYHETFQKPPTTTQVLNRVLAVSFRMVLACAKEEGFGDILLRNLKYMMELNKDLCVLSLALTKMLSG